MADLHLPTKGEINMLMELTLDEAREVLGVSRQTMHAWLSSGRITGRRMRPSHPWLFHVDEVERVRQELIADLQRQIDELSVTAKEFALQ